MQRSSFRNWWIRKHTECQNMGEKHSWQFLKICWKFLKVSKYFLLSWKSNSEWTFLLIISNRFLLWSKLNLGHFFKTCISKACSVSLSTIEFETPFGWRCRSSCQTTLGGFFCSLDWTNRYWCYKKSWH